MVEQMLIDHQSLSELIANQIKKKIWNKELPLGERLIETELAQTFDVSRSTIREAFKILEMDGLIVRKARKGTYITTFTTKDVEEITELRMMIESRAFIHALPHMDDEDFQHLTTLTKQMKQTANQKNWNALFDLDMEFHRYVVNRSHHVRMIKIYNSLHAQIRTVLMHFDQLYASFHSLYKEHVDLLQALKTKDPSMVQKSVNDHIAYVGEAFLGVNTSSQP
ncbi:MAG TPA: GntR family transcriptional regulator [Bacillota bacterium]|nr:GntR family transcriptional regulator [Bacillota bacterium]